MNKQDTKKILIETGAKLFHIKGYKNSGLNEILNSAGVPKGSFYFYFKSKEDYTLHIIDYFVDNFVTIAKKYLEEDKSASHLERLKKMFSDNEGSCRKMNCSGGCPIGNLAQEVSDINEAIREKIKEAYISMKKPIEKCLKEASANGEISSSINIHEAAAYVLNSWEGALLAMKLTKSTDSIKLFMKVLFESYLI